jgi:hypothetical protein
MAFNANCGSMSGCIVWCLKITALGQRRAVTTASPPTLMALHYFSSSCSCQCDFIACWNPDMTCCSTLMTPMHDVFIFLLKGDCSKDCFEKFPLRPFYRWGHVGHWTPFISVHGKAQTTLYGCAVDLLATQRICLQHLDTSICGIDKSVGGKICRLFVDLL